MGAAYGVSQSHAAAGPAAAWVVARLDRLAHRTLFAANGQGELNGVDVRLRDHGWAVGSACLATCARQDTLIEHWNDRRWSQVPSPNPSGTPSVNLLQSVTTVSGRDAWAAGYVEQRTSTRPVVMHWNGTRWSTVPSPGRTSNSEISSVSSASARDIWAVGDYGETLSHPLIEHWVGAVCADHCERAKPPSRVVILHWNGRRWAVAVSPNPGAASALGAVSATSATNAWAVGQYCTKACALPLIGGSQGQVLILHWNGARWSRVTAPSLGRGEHILASVRCPAAAPGLSA
ncbi:MAG: hypothetical protein ACRDRJ_34430 [Streptosporangiaceae bacterium]